MAQRDRTEGTLRRAQAHAAARSGILDAARRVARRGGARDLSLRSVAAEAGFAPAALYGYFAGKDELLLALAADDLAVLARAMREAAAQLEDKGQARRRRIGRAGIPSRMRKFWRPRRRALATRSGASDAERLFNGRLIAALKVLVRARPAIASRAATSQCDAVLLAAAVAGLALLARSGRLEALGFSARKSSRGSTRDSRRWNSYRSRPASRA